MNGEKYLYRRQFLLGPIQIPGLSTWSRLELGAGLHVAAHPDLPVIREDYQGKTIVLLGYILDPYEPSWTDRDIIKEIIRRISSAEDALLALNRHCGRFVVIIRTSKELRVFHDPGGLRQVYYYVDSSHRCWCASQPTILADHFSLSWDEDIVADFKRSALFAEKGDYWFPGGVTIYKGIRRLPPNHYLDLRTHRVIRFWPQKQIEQISFSSCLEETTRLLVGTFLSAAKRYKLALGISCGLDSRLLLAASKFISRQIQFFTWKPANLSDDDPTISIPRDLMQGLQLKHKTIVRPNHLPADFFLMLQRNVMAAKEGKGINAFSLKKDLFDEQDDYHVIFGNLSEITKRDRYRYPNVPKLLWSGTFLTECLQMTGSRIARDELTRWLSSVKGFSAYNLNALDLAHWEHRVGGWAAMSFSEYDISSEVICPYNNRRYIELMLGVPFRYRTMPEYELHHEMIRSLWPETLKVDIQTISSRFKGWQKSSLEFLYKTNIYDYFKYAQLMSFRRFLRASNNKRTFL